MSDSLRASEGSAQPFEKNGDQRTETKDERLKTRDVSPGVQCPNCCKLAPVTARQMGLLYFRCELCGSVGATPEGTDAT